MAREFKVKVYEDHYLVSAEQGAGTIVAEKGALEATLGMQEQQTPEKKRTGGTPRRKRRTKAEIEAAAKTPAAGAGTGA